MNFIVAVDKSYNIGNDDKLLMYLPEDLKYFKKTTTGKVIVMGRKTLESLPKSSPLPNRTNIVLTFNEDYNKEGCIISHSIKELFEILKDYNEEDIFIIGGANIYDQLIPYCKYGYITKIKQTFNVNKSINNVDKMPNWNKICESNEMSYEGVKYTFTKYENNNIKHI
jgi:dihydrofolate reductase